jgi:hypothetical protein
VKGKGKGKGRREGETAERGARDRLFPHLLAAHGPAPRAQCRDCAGSTKVDWHSNLGLILDLH